MNNNNYQIYFDCGFSKLRVAAYSKTDLNKIYYTESKFLFDPASYGQFLNGTNTNRGNYILRRRSISIDHTIGKELKSKRVSVKFKDKRPIVYFDNKSYKLINLHIHSKNLFKFVAEEYNTHVVELP